MKKKFFAVFLVCLLCVGSLCGCSGKDSSFILAIDTLPQTIDPQLASSQVECNIAINLFEGLFRENADGEVVNAACESYTVSPDGKTYTFTLKDGLTYNDGNADKDIAATPLTAADFVFALQRIFSYGTVSPYSSVFSSIQNASAVLNGQAEVSSLGVSAPDAQTLIIRLDYADNELPRKLCCAGAMPCNRAFYENTQGTYGLDTDTTLANGPFRISLWSTTSGITLRRITETEGLVNRVRMILNDQSKTAEERLSTGTTNGEFITGLPENDEKTYCVSTRVMAVNCADSQLSVADIRAGLAGVLYDTLDAAPAPADWLNRAQGILPPSLSFAGQGWRSYAGDVLAACRPVDAAADFRSGLEQAGIAKLNGITVLVPDTEEWHTMYDEIALAWQTKLSAFFSVEYLSMEQIRQKVNDGDYQIAFLTVSVDKSNVYAELARFTTGDAGNYTAFSSEQYDALLAQAELAVTEAQRGTLYVQAEKVLLSDWPVVPLYTEICYFATSAEFVGIAASPFGPTMDFTFAAVVPQ